MYSKKNNRWYHLMMIPGMILLVIFSLVPMTGILIAFEKFVPAKGIFRSKWIGLYNFRYLFKLPDFQQIFVNTLVIAIFKIMLQIIVPVLVALMLNEIRGRYFKRAVQTVIYLPHFLSWVILAGIVSNMLSLDGFVNSILAGFGMERQMFLASNKWFRGVIIATDVWKEFGFGTIVYLAAMTSIDVGLYEAAEVDGATRFQKILHITLPGILPIVVLMLTLSMGNVLNAGFEQIFNLYNPLVYETGDILDTYVHRAGLVNAQYGLATAVGLFKSVISFILITACYIFADKVLDYKIL